MTVPAFVSHVPLQVFSTNRRKARQRQQSPTCALPPSSSSSKPRIVVLPGLDGSELLLAPFRAVLTTPDDPQRVIAASYPPALPLSVAELAAHVTSTYLRPLHDDPRGYILVSQSFSGHVAFHLAASTARPAALLGHVFVNTFTSPPFPRILHNWQPNVPDALLRRQPPPWMVAGIFLGERQGMDVVQAAARRVEPAVFRQRLHLCLREEAWHVWRSRKLLPAESTLYLRGEADAIVRKNAAESMRVARPDIEWVHVPKGPHLLLQRFGRPCGRAVDAFSERLVGRAKQPP